MSDKKIRLIEPPIEYECDDEADKPFLGNYISKRNFNEPWPDPNKLIRDED